MATALLFIGWNRPVPGKETEAWKYFMEEADAALTKFQKQGYFERVERVALTPHAGTLNGFVLLGRKPNGESYRPDEVELLEFAAHQVGLDLHALEVEELRRELQRARAAEDALRTVIATERSAPLERPAE